jgi:hypothetical protein
LCTPLVTSRLSSAGVDGDEYSLHALWWYACEASSPAFLTSLTEWSVLCMYELIVGQHDKRDDDGRAAQSSASYSAHVTLTTLSPSSFSSVSITLTSPCTQ